MNRAMIDLETLSTKPNAVILQIGVCLMRDDLSICKCWEVGINREEMELDLFSVEPQTVKWWSQQDRALMEKVMSGTTLPKVALQALSDHMTEFTIGEVWANSPAFDLVILRNAFERYEIDCPWQFWAERDIRTLKKLIPSFKLERRGPKHDALADAVFQMEELRHCLKHLREKGAAR